MGDRVVGELAVVFRAELLQQRLAGGHPVLDRVRIVRHHLHRTCERVLGAVDRRVGSGPLCALGALVARNEPRDVEPPARRRSHRVAAGAGRGSLDEQIATWLHVERIGQRAVDGPPREDVAARLGEVEGQRRLEQLGRLGGHELLVGAIGRFVPLDPEVGEHRVPAGLRRERVELPGADVDEVADLDPSLVRDAGPGLDDQHEPAGAHDASRGRGPRTSRPARR